MSNLVLLSTKDLKYQMVGQRTEKLTEHFVGSYKVKAIIFSNKVELELPSSIRIHSVVNVSCICRYKSQVEGQKSKVLQPIIIDREEEWKMKFTVYPTIFFLFFLIFFSCIFTDFPHSSGYHVIFTFTFF